MDLMEANFDLFQRETYSFSKLKELYPTSEMETLKSRYKSDWQRWKLLNQEVHALLKTTTPFPKPRIERWTNGWIIRSHFWAVYKTTRRINDATLIGVMINEKNIRVHVEWQHFKAKTSTSTPQEYNQLLDLVPEWSERIDLTHYHIWLSSDSELDDYLKLTDYLANPNIQKEFQKSLNKGETFEIGFILPKQEIKNIEELIAQKIDELDLLYTRN